MYLSVNYRNAERERPSDVEDVKYYKNNIHFLIFSRYRRVLKRWSYIQNYGLGPFFKLYSN